MTGNSKGKYFAETLFSKYWTLTSSRGTFEKVIKRGKSFLPVHILEIFSKAAKKVNIDLFNHCFSIRFTPKSIWFWP